MGIVFVTQLIPQLTGLIESSAGGQIPLGAKLLMGTSDFFMKWWIVLLLVIAASLVLFKAWKENEANRPTWDRVKLKASSFWESNRTSFLRSIFGDNGKPRR